MGDLAVESHAFEFTTPDDGDRAGLRPILVAVPVAAGDRAEPTVDLIFAIASAMAHGAAALDAEQIENPNETLSYLLARVWPQLFVHANRVFECVAEIRALADLHTEGERR
jgi:hypothetical protein